MEEYDNVITALSSAKEEKQKIIQKLTELNKTIFEYEMRFFLISKKREITNSNHLLILKRIEKKIRKKFSKFE